jgi:hypothetical protein
MWDELVGAGVVCLVSDEIAFSCRERRYQRTDSHPKRDYEVLNAVKLRE